MLFKWYARETNCVGVFSDFVCCFFDIFMRYFVYNIANVEVKSLKPYFMWLRSPVARQ